MTNPLPPTGVTVSARATQLVINWNAPNGRTDLTYEIEVSVFDNDLLPTIYPSASMSFTLNVADTARRFFRIRCVDTAQSRSTWTATISKAATPPGTFTEGVDLDMSNHTLLNLSDPVLAQEPATKAYVDAHANANGGGQLFPPNGDLSMGNHKLTNVATPTSTTDATTKAYVDARPTGQAFPPSTDLSLGSHTLTSVNDPVNPQDAATKHYVDAISVGQSFPPGTDLSLSGHTFTNLRNPSADQEVATKYYVDHHANAAADSDNPDIIPETPNVMDDEFNATVLANKWMWFNQSSTVYSLGGGRLQFTNANGGQYGSFIAQPISGSTWTFASKQSINYNSGYYGLGLFVYNSATGAFTQICGYTTGVTWVNQWGSYTGLYGGSPIQLGQNAPTSYYKISLASGVLTFYYSVDGIQYAVIGTIPVASYMGAITHVGIGVYNNTPGAGTFGWFRKLA